QLASETGTRTANLADTLPDKRPEETALAKVLGQVVPMIEKLTKRVDEIARTPLPPDHGQRHCFDIEAAGSRKQDGQWRPRAVARNDRRGTRQDEQGRTDANVDKG